MDALQQRRMVVTRDRYPRPPRPRHSGDIPNLGLEQFPRVTCNTCHHPAAHGAQQQPTLARTGDATVAFLAVGVFFLCIGNIIRKLARKG